jgi:protein KTI12
MLALARFDNLIQRYEEPNPSARWDAPLFAVPWDEPIPVDGLFQALVSGKKPPTNQATVLVTDLPVTILGADSEANLQY